MKEIEFKPKFVTNAVEHMNDDHRDAMVEMLHGFYAADWVTDAELLHFNKEQMEIRGLGVNGRVEDFNLPYDEPLKQAKEFRPALIAMLNQARNIGK
ncbi:MAG: DUF2470 domain-containing protein [Bacteroidota bacterium]